VADIHFSGKSLWNKKSDRDKHLENLPTLFLQHDVSIFDNFSCGIVDFLSKPKNQKKESVLTKFPGKWNGTSVKLSPTHWKPYPRTLSLFIKFHTCSNTDLLLNYFINSYSNTISPPPTSLFQYHQLYSSLYMNTTINSVAPRLATAARSGRRSTPGFKDIQSVSSLSPT